MTKEEVSSIVKYCNDNGVSYKARLSELGVPEWKFFESRGAMQRSRRFPHQLRASSFSLTAGGDFVPMPAFAAKTGRGFSKKNSQAPKMISVELRIQNGTMMRIQGELDKDYLQSIIQASSGRVWPE